jgi:hypothetical protein
MDDWLYENVVKNIAEELAEEMGMSFPANCDMLKVAGAMVTTEAVSSAMDILVPAASSAVGFSTSGITLALIQRKLREITKKIDCILDANRKVAKDILSEALTSLEHENYSDAYDAFKKASDKAVEGFHTSQVGYSNSLVAPLRRALRFHEFFFKKNQKKTKKKIPNFFFKQKLKKLKNTYA